MVTKSEEYSLADGSRLDSGWVFSFVTLFIKHSLSARGRAGKMSTELQMLLVMLH